MTSSANDESQSLPSDADSLARSHNREQPAVWERWSKKRTFVRALEGTYSELTKDLLDQPRVLSFRDKPWKGGPQHYLQPQASPNQSGEPTA